jgi:hypothetical protein
VTNRPLTDSEFIHLYEALMKRLVEANEVLGDSKDLRVASAIQRGLERFNGQISDLLAQAPSPMIAMAMMQDQMRLLSGFMFELGRQFQMGENPETPRPLDDFSDADWEAINKQLNSGADKGETE